MAVHYQVQIDIDNAEKQLKQLTSDFMSAFNSGKTFQGTRSELELMIAQNKKKLDALVKEEKRLYAELDKLGEAAEHSPLNKMLDVTEKQIEDTQKTVEALKQTLKDMPSLDLSEKFKAGKEFSGTKFQLKERIAELRAELHALKIQYKETKEELEQKGIVAAPILEPIADSIKETEAELDGLLRRFQETQQESGNFFSGVAQGAQGLMGAFTAAQGAAAMFGAEEEKLQQIQTKLQASMSILMGLQQVANTLQSTSTFRIQVLNKLQAAWHAWNLKVAASEGIKKVAMMGVLAVIPLLIAGITTLIVKFSKYSEEVKLAKELSKEFREGFANSASEQISTLTKLQAGWAATNGSIAEQQKFIAQNQKEFESLGLSVKNVNDAESALVKNNSKVVEAIMAKAQAAAHLAQINSLVAQSMALQAEIEDKESLKPSIVRSGIATSILSEGGSTMSIDEHQEMVVERRVEEIEEERAKLQTKIDELLVKYTEDLKKIAETGGNGALDEQYNKNLQSRIKAAEDGYKALMRLNEDRERALADAKIAAINNEAERELAELEANHQKRLAQIERDKEDYIEKLKEQAKLEFLKNPNNKPEDFNENWKPSAEQQEEVDKYYNALADYEIQSYQHSHARVIAERNKSEYDYWQKYGNPKQAEAAIKSYYKALRDAAKDGYEEMALIEEEDEKIWQLRNGSRLQYLEEYGTIAEKEQALNEKYNHDLENTQDEYQRLILKQKHDQDLFNLQKQKGGKYYNIFRDTDRMNIVEITDAMKLAEEEIEKLSEDAAGNADKIQALKGALENLKAAANDFSLSGVLRSLFSSDKDDPSQKASFKERIEGIKKAWAEMSPDAKGKAIGGWASNIAQSLGKAAQYMRDVAEAAGDPRLAETAEKLDAISQNFIAAGQGAASGGWIGAVVAGGSDLIGQTIEALEETPLLEARAAKAAEDWERALKNVNVAMQEIAYNSPFGERSIAKGREAMRSSIEAMKRYNEEIAAINKKYSEQEIETYTYGGLNSVGANVFINPLGWLSGKSTFSNEWLAYNNAINKGYEGLQRMLVKTKDRNKWANLWGAQDEYKALGDLYPELFKDGELVVEQAKLLLETNNQLDESQKEQIKNLVDLKEKYDEAMKAIDDVISETFGQLASDITDVIWDSVMHGTDAWAEFQKVGSEAITKLGKQLIQEMLISSYLNQFKKRMEDAYMLGDAQRQQAELRTITADIFNGLHGVFDDLAAVALDYKEWAEKEGFDLLQAEERTAASKAISGVSQETFNEMSGRVTSIQLSAYNIDETTQAIREQQTMMATQVAQILLVLNGIHGDTGGIREAVAGLRDDMTLVKSTLGTIADKGVRMLN